MVRSPFRFLTILVLLGTAAWPGDEALSQPVPVPPCAGMPVPAAGTVGATLNQIVWVDDEVPANWRPPGCTGWTAGPTKVVVAGSGRFRLSGDSTTVVERLASISGMTDIVYWSVTRSRWRNLFEESAALRESDRNSQRPDFSADEFVPDAEFYYWLREDNPTAGVVYQLRVLERTPDRLVFETVNTTAMRASLLVLRTKIAEPGELRQLSFIERENGDVWRFYSIMRLGEAKTLAGTSADNYRNRAEAYFRYLAGIPMDQEPPAAP